MYSNHAIDTAKNADVGWYNESPNIAEDLGHSLEHITSRSDHRILPCELPCPANPDLMAGIKTRPVRNPATSALPTPLMTITSMAVDRVSLEAGNSATASANHAASAVLNTAELLEQIPTYINHMTLSLTCIAPAMPPST